MALGFVGVKNFCRLCIQGMVYSSKSAGNIFMYSRFAYPKRCGGASHRAFLCYKVFRQLARSIIRVIKQDAHLVIVLFALTLYVRHMNLMTKINICKILAMLFMHFADFFAFKHPKDTNHALCLIFQSLFMHIGNSIF